MKLAIFAAFASLYDLLQGFFSPAIQPRTSLAKFLKQPKRWERDVTFCSVMREVRHESRSVRSSTFPEFLHVANQREDFQHACRHECDASTRPWHFGTTPVLLMWCGSLEILGSALVCVSFSLSGVPVSRGPGVSRCVFL